MDPVTQGVLKEFEYLAAIPRPSRQERAVAEALAARLRGLGLAPELDAANNLICDVPATCGSAKAPRIALQAHTDMVCVGAADYCPEKDPIVTVLKDGWLCTDGRSSLGADCGIGLAAAMYLVFSGADHGPLRLIFTADEEEGLAGAKRLRPDCLEGCGALVNLDSFHFGELLVSSAGGCRQTFRKAAEETEYFFPMLERSVSLRISGLLGGHSGDDIGKNRANAGQLLVWLLQALQVPYELSAIDAGRTHNAIPTEATAVLLLDEASMEEFRSTIDRFLSELRELYPAEQPEISLSDAPRPMRVLTVDERDNLLAMAGLLLCGEAECHPLFPEVTGSSGSMGVLHAGEDGLELRSFLRSVSDDFMSGRSGFYAMAAEGFGFTVSEESYPAWPAAERDWLTECFLREGERLGIPQKKTAVHVGLETGILHACAPELPMVSVGMDIEGAHSPTERVRLSTIAPFTRLLAAVLKAAAEDKA